MHDRKRVISLQFTLSPALLMAAAIALVSAGCGPKGGSNSEPATAESYPGDKPVGAAPERSPSGERQPEGTTASPETGQPAQENPYGAKEGDGQAPAAKVSDGQIATYAAAYKEIMQVQSKLQVDMQNAPDATAAKQLQSEAQQRAMAILKRHNITPDAYQAFFNRLGRDAELRARFQKHLQSEGRKQDGPGGSKGGDGQ